MESLMLHPGGQQNSIVISQSMIYNNSTSSICEENYLNTKYILCKCKKNCNEHICAVSKVEQVYKNHNKKKVCSF